MSFSFWKLCELRVCEVRPISHWKAANSESFYTDLNAQTHNKLTNSPHGPIHYLIHRSD